MQLKRPFLSEVQWARALALFAVLFVHSTSTGMGASTPFSLPYTGYSILNIAGKIGTSTFIFLSSFILFYTYYPREFTMKLFTSFYKNRLLYILVPYIVFSIFYFALRYDINGFQLTWPEIIAKFADELLSGNAYTHLYFVYVSVQFYLMFPIFLYLFKRFEWLRKWALPLGIVIQWVWVLANTHYFQVDEKGSVSLSYFMFYFMGAFLGVYYESFVAWLKDARRSRGVLIGVVALYLAMTVSYYYVTVMARTGTKYYPSWIHELTWSTMALTAGFLIFIVAHAIKRFNVPRFKATLVEIGAVSFGIYLIHPYLLYWMREWLPGGAPLVFHGWQVLTFFVVFFGSWLIVRLVYDFVPASWIIFGKGNKVWGWKGRVKKA